MLHADDWKPIPPEDLALKDNPDDPGAPAMILYREEEIHGDQGTETAYMRIKILTEAGRKYADIRLAVADPWEDSPFWAPDVSIDEIQGRTIHPDGSIIPFAGTVYETDTGLTKARTFALPDVTPGSIIEYKCRIKWNAAKMYPGMGWLVQLSLFQREAYFFFEPSSHLPAAIEYLTFGLQPGQQPVRQGSKLWLHLNNIPAFEQEQFMPPADAVRARVEFFVRPHDFEPSPDQYWKKRGKEWANQVDDFIGKSNKIKSQVQALVSPSDTSSAKLLKIYEHVQTLRNLSFESRRAEKEIEREHLKENQTAEDVLTHGYGAHNELNRTFVAMARSAGFDATVVAVSRRDQTVFRRDLESMAQLSLEVALVSDGGKELYLDPGMPMCPFGIVPWMVTGVTGLRADKHSAAFVTTPVATAADAGIASKAQLTLEPDGSLTGMLEVTFSGQEALQIRLQGWMRQFNEHQRKVHIQKMVRDWLTVSGTVRLRDVNAWDNPNVPLTATLKIVVPGYATMAGQHLLAPTTLFSSAYANPFVSTRRANPIYFPYPYVYTDDVTITPADGLQIEGVSSPVERKNDLAEFSKSNTLENGALHLERDFRLKAVFVDVKGYPAVKAFYDYVADQDKDRVALKLAAK
jgi:hypothetical protein